VVTTPARSPPYICDMHAKLLVDFDCTDSAPPQSPPSAGARGDRRRVAAPARVGATLSGWLDSNHPARRTGFLSTMGPALSLLRSLTVSLRPTLCGKRMSPTLLSSQPRDGPPPEAVSGTPACIQRPPAAPDSFTSESHNASPLPPWTQWCVRRWGTASSY
jgi:hypothetical protein